MTATTTSRTADAATTHRRHVLAGTGTLVRFLLRRDRIKLPAWTGGLALFVVYLTNALPVVAETEEELRGATQLFNDPVGRMLTGPGYGFDEPTFARFIANGYGLYFLIIAALMSILLVTRHTRVEEQSGRAELVRANVVGRHAPLTATVIVAAVTNVVAGGLVAATMIGVGGFDAEGSLLFGASIAATGLAFAGLTTITVQLSEYSRAAAGLAGAVLGAAFVIRIPGDMAEIGGNAWSWLSPLAWGQQAAPFVLDRWWPLLLPLASAVVTTAIGFRISTRRDLAASVFAVRPGPARAAGWLGTPLGLAFRLQRASIIGWSAALGATGLLYGAYADALLTAMDDMPETFLELFGAEDLLGGYIAYMATFEAYLAGVFVVLAVQGFRNEETSGRGEPVLATPVSRWAWLGSNVVVTAAATAVILTVAGLLTGIATAVVTGEGAYVWDVTAAHVNQTPAVLVVLGVATLLLGVLPRAIPASWALVGYGLFAGTFGPMMDLPQAAANLSPFEHPAEMPLEPFDLLPVVVLLAIAAGTVALGLLGLRRRDLDTA